MRIGGRPGNLTGNLPLQAGVDEVFHPHGRLMHVMLRHLSTMAANPPMPGRSGFIPDLIFSEGGVCRQVPATGTSTLPHRPAGLRGSRKQATTRFVAIT